jgi:hypothetical protein
MGLASKTVLIQIVDPNCASPVQDRFPMRDRHSPLASAGFVAKG